MNNIVYYCPCRPCQPKLPGVHCYIHPTITTTKKHLAYIYKKIRKNIKKQKFYLSVIEHPSFSSKDKEVQHNILAVSNATTNTLENYRREKEFLRNQLAIILEKGRL